MLEAGNGVQQPQCALLCFKHSSQDEHGRDGDPCTLRAALQAVEKRGVVDFELAGHQCSRPAEVCQGQEEDDRPQV